MITRLTALPPPDVTVDYIAWFSWRGDHDRIPANLVRRLAAVCRARRGADGSVNLDIRHARLRGRGRTHGDPLHGADVAVVLLPRLLRRRAGAAVAECLDAMAAPQPPLSRRQLRRLA